MFLEIIHQDDLFIAINKPHGLLVHRTPIAKDATEFALQLLRDQVGYHVYPAHRIDRKTSGVLLFSKSKAADSKVQKLFMKHEVEKTYLAIVRGWTLEEQTIDYPIGEPNKKKEAITHYRCLEQFEIPVPLGKHNTSRYSLLEVKPITGRFHQIRQHLSHIFHPIIGDRPHGCSKQNRMWKSKYLMTSMMLHAQSLKIRFDETESIDIQAPISDEFKRVLNILNQN